jgi:FkbM family methyltransferase
VGATALAGYRLGAVTRARLRTAWRGSLAAAALLIAAKAARAIKVPRRAEQLRDVVRSSYRLLGLRGTALLLYHRVGGALPGDERRYTLTPRNALHPLDCRSRTSDADVFNQIFIECTYDNIEELEHAEFVVDCGANCGYSTAYFLTRCPRAEVIAIEPDADNAAMLARNTLAYGSRVQLLRSAIWSHPTALVVSGEIYRDGRAWTRIVREARPGEPNSFQAVDIGTLLRDSTHERISILKVDIEGSEGVVFSAGYESWLPRVDNILIELHDDSPFGDCSSIFRRAIADEGFAISHYGELVVCRRNPRSP